MLNTVSSYSSSLSNILWLTSELTCGVCSSKVKMPQGSGKINAAASASASAVAEKCFRKP